MGDQGGIHVQPASGTERRTGVGRREPPSCHLNGISEDQLFHAPRHDWRAGRRAPGPWRCGRGRALPSYKEAEWRERTAPPGTHVGWAVHQLCRCGNQQRDRRGPRLWSAQRHNLTRGAAEAGVLSSAPVRASQQLLGACPSLPGGVCAGTRGPGAGDSSNLRPPVSLGSLQLALRSAAVELFRVLLDPQSGSLSVRVPQGRLHSTRGQRDTVLPAPHWWARGHQGLGEHGGRRQTPPMGPEGFCAPFCPTSPSPRRAPTRTHTTLLCSQPEQPRA